MQLGTIIYDKLEELGRITEPGAGVTRLYLTEEHRQAMDLLERWMRQAGLTTRRDAASNLIGEYHSSPDAKTLLIGSHQDTVRMGGKFDGALGVVLPIVCAGKLIEAGRLGCNLKVLAFGDEEGVRFSTTYLGSKAYCGTFSPELLKNADESGVTLRQALTDFGGRPDQIGLCKECAPADGYLEIHIEQGPVLESKNLPLGIVTAIQSSHRYEISIHGTAGHAGTVPMHLRRDALTTAAAAITAMMERVRLTEGLVATVGKMQVFPGAPNVIPSQATFSLDIRCHDEACILAAVLDIEELLRGLCHRDGLSYAFTQTNRAPATMCDGSMIQRLEEALLHQNIHPLKMVSGAGHDAQELKSITEIGVLFVRCRDGVSHSPLESVQVEDIDVAANAVISLVENFR